MHPIEDNDEGRLENLETDFRAIQEAYEYSKEIIQRTDVRELSWIKKLCGVTAYGKFENHQITGAFKIRGAIERCRKQDPSTPIITASAGNHALAIAEAAKIFGLDATICLPVNASTIKKERLSGYNHTLLQEGASVEEATKYAKELATKKNGDFISPYNDIDIIHGQGTLAIEFLEQIPELDVIVIPIGGGGLISGMATAIKSINPRIKVIGVEPEQYASYVKSYQSGQTERVINYPTLADGLAANLEEESITLNYGSLVDEFITVSEEEIAAATLAILKHESQVIEPAGATGLAALMSQKLQVETGQKVGFVFTGGNVSISNISRVINYPYSDSKLYPFINVVGEKTEEKQIIKSVDFSRNGRPESTKVEFENQADDVSFDREFVGSRFDHVRTFAEAVRIKLDDYLKYCEVEDLSPDEPSVQLIKDEIDSLKKKLESVSIDLDPNQEAGSYSQKYTYYMSLYRAMLHQVMIANLTLDWRSASYAQSKNTQFFDLEKQNSPNCNYNRYESMYANSIEKQLGEILQVDQSKHMPILTSSGMSAYGLIESYLLSRERLSPGDKIMIANYLYFEIDEQIAKHKNLFEVIRPNTYDEEELLKTIEKERPKVVFVDPLVNTPELRMCDVIGILNGASELDWEEDVYFVIDGSMVSGEISKHLNKIPPNSKVKVLYHESASKYLQLGLDISMGGVALVPVEDFNEFDRIRRNNGAIMYDPQALVFPKYDSVMHMGRMKRFTRNSILIANEFNNDEFLKENLTINFPGIPTHPDYELSQQFDSVGGIVTFSFSNDSHNQREALNRLIDYVLLSCKGIGASLTKGVSFGFSLPRISAASALAESCPPFLRLSVGDRSLKETQLLVEGLKNGFKMFIKNSVENE